jgi:hypothetical protein
MLVAWIMTAVVVTNPTPPAAPDLPVYRVPGPAFEIPYKVTDRTPDLVAVQLWVSADCGKSWEQAGEANPGQGMFKYHAKKPGEYCYAPRLKFKDGRVMPRVGELEPQHRVVVEAGHEPVTPARATLLTKVADDLDEELTRLEFELIRKEIKQLAEMKGLTQDTADKIDRLRSRLREAQNRLQNRGRGTTDPLINPTVVPDPLPSVPESRSNRNENLIPPPGRPVPVSPAPPAAPPPPAPVPRS